MKDLAIAYRIYPGISKTPAIFSEDKLRLSRFCLESFRSALGSLRVKLWVLLDDCPAEYEAIFQELFRGEELELVFFKGRGNFHTFCAQVDILSEQDESKLVYFAEDDYFYLPGAIEEMVDLVLGNSDADFVTPYDHPDYYSHQLHNGRHYIKHSGKRHWRTASTTCMTFLTTKRTLLHTKKQFLTYRKKNNDASIWMSLTKGGTGILSPLRNASNRPLLKLWTKAWFFGWHRILLGKQWRLWAPIPSLGTHMERSCLAPSVEWPFRNTESGSLREL